MTLPIDTVRQHISEAQAELQALTQRLYSGEIGLEQWEAAAATVIKDAHLANSAAAVGADSMSSVEYGRVGGNLADEYNFLADFADAINSGDISEAQALARINQYGQAAQQSYWSEYGRQAETLAGLPSLNQVPGDGGTRCHGNCNCELSNEDDGIHWNLNPGENCDDCVALAAGGPYRPGNL